MRVTSTDDVTLEVHDLGGDGPTVLIAHATGFCAGAYRPLAARLAERFRVWALDFRAHGDSTTPTGGDLTWRGMADDVLTVAEALGGGPVLGVGHSMGGACLLGAERRAPGTVRAAYVFEPIIVPTDFGDGPGGNPLADAARRRRPGFPSRLAALGRYAGRPPLGAFRADALAAYVEHGFADAPDGSVVLKCPPDNEAAVFEATGKPQLADMGAIAVPVMVACGARDGDAGPARFAPEVADAIAGATLRRYAHLGHFGPFQDPDTIADDVTSFFAGS
ncbi:alpha/beta hydrolase [soil metagenome]